MKSYRLLFPGRAFEQQGILFHARAATRSIGEDCIHIGGEELHIMQRLLARQVGFAGVQSQTRRSSSVRAG